jgi:hypothetical protein
MRRRGDSAERLSNAERLDIRRRVAEGETFEAATKAVGVRPSRFSDWLHALEVCGRG